MISTVLLLLNNFIFEAYVNVPSESNKRINLGKKSYFVVLRATEEQDPDRFPYKNVTDPDNCPFYSAKHSKLSPVKFRANTLLATSCQLCFSNFATAERFVLLLTNPFFVLHGGVGSEKNEKHYKNAEYRDFVTHCSLKNFLKFFFRFCAFP